MQENLQFEITCRQVWREISNFLENDVAPDLRARLELHFADCNHCRALLDGTRNTVTLIADGRAFELPADVSQRMYSRLSEFLKK